MRRLIRSFAGRIYHIVENLMSRLIYELSHYTNTYFLFDLAKKIQSPNETTCHVSPQIIYTDPKWKLYIVLKSVYFDDKLSFDVNFFCHRIFNVLSMSLKKILDENQILHNFYE